MLDPLDIPRFTTAQAAKACGVTAGSLAAVLHRGAVALAGDEAPEARNPGTGRTRLFSARRVLHLAVTLELAAVGVAMPLASKLALHFTDTGGAESDKATVASESDPEPRRPGHLIRDEQTVLRVLYPLDGSEPVARVEPISAVQAGPLRGDSLCYRAALLIDLDALHHHTLIALGMQSPRHAL